MAREEIFGPVICLMKPFKTMEEALERANDTNYGLAGGIFTSNMNIAEKCTRELHFGTVWVNNYNWTPCWAPFGGMKESGFGRDNCYETM